MQPVVQFSYRESHSLQFVLYINTRVPTQSVMQGTHFHICTSEAMYICRIAAHEGDSECIVNSAIYFR